jgi:DnaJ-class molecular chaperone
MDYTHPNYWPQLIDLSNRIDTLTYFEILNLPETATHGEIRRAYYQLARSLHPDKFYHLEDTNVRQAIHLIYKRVTESYAILKDDTKKQRYLKNIAGENRSAYLRYDEQQQLQQQKEEREQQEKARTPQGKKMYQAALVELGNGNFTQALKNIQSALLFESGNSAFEELRDAIKEKSGVP